MKPSRQPGRFAPKVNTPFKSPLKRPAPGESPSSSSSSLSSSSPPQPSAKQPRLTTKLDRVDISLALTLRELRRDVDTLTQASAILTSQEFTETSTLDGQRARAKASLMQQTARYAAAARCAADELLPLAAARLRDQSSFASGGSSDAESSGYLTMGGMLRMLGVEAAALGWVDDDDGEGHWA